MGNNTGLSPKQRVALILAGALLVLVLPLIVNAALSSLYTADPGITYDASDGPEIELATTLESDAAEPFPDNNTVDMSPQATFYSDGPTRATVNQFGADGSQTQLSNLNVSAHRLEVDVDGHDRVAIQGDADTLTFDDLSADTGEILSVTQSGTSEISLWGIEHDRVAVLDADTDEVLDNVATDDGVATFDVDGDRAIELRSADGPPEIDTETADPTGTQETIPGTLQVDVASGTGIDEELDVAFELNGESVGTDTVTGSGTASTAIDFDDVGTHTWTVTVTDEFGNTSTETFEFTVLDDPPQIDRDSAEPVGTQTEFPDTLQVDVAPGTDIATNLSVEFELDGESVGTDTVTGSGTASTPINDEMLGSHTWTVTVTDEYNETSTETFEYATPNELYIRDEQNPGELVTTDSTVEVTFFESDSERVFTRTTNDGTVSLEGLPNEEFTVQVDADGYVTRQAIIRGITEQQDVYILNESADAVQTRFVLEDPTGQFDQDSSRVFVQKPMEINNETVYRTVVADQLGTSGYSTLLERDQRYRIQVENMDTGEMRTLGPYVATASETVTLQVDEIDFEFSNEEMGYRWSATYENETAPAIDFAFESESTVEQLSVVIRERGGDETVILDESYVGETSINELATIPESANESTTWVVEWTATIDGEEISGSHIVGPEQMPVDVPGVPDSVLQVVGVGLLLLIGGLFSAANVEIGAIVVSLGAGFLWFVGALPGAVSGMLIATALLLSVLFWARRARGEQ